MEMLIIFTGVCVYAGVCLVRFKLALLAHFWIANVLSMGSVEGIHVPSLEHIQCQWVAVEGRPRTLRKARLSFLGF